MADVRVLRYRDWIQFKADIVRDLFGVEPFCRERYLFRGQRSADWRLTPSLDRWVESFPRGDRLRMAETLLDNFIAECEGTDVESTVCQDRRLMLALAQHHGVPTRLLDWTDSPYVAAF